MTTRGTPRPAWTDLPADLRYAVEALLGGRVVLSESRPGGWSPGSADVVTTASGRRAFVKAADAEVNARTVAMHRREAGVLEALAGSGVAPEPIGAAEAGSAFALVVELLDGRHPDPGDVRDTCAVLDAVQALPDPIPTAVPPAGTDTRAEVEDGAAGWARVLDAGASGVPGGEATASRLATLSSGAGDAVAGTGLVHFDLRPDNVLVLPDGTARIIDWPNAVAGASWFDGLTYLLDVRHLGGATPLDHPVLAEVPDDVVDAALAGLAGYLFAAALRPEPASMAGIRTFQRVQGVAVVEWLRERGALPSNLR